MTCNKVAKRFFSAFHDSSYAPTNLTQKSMKNLLVWWLSQKIAAYGICCCWQYQMSGWLLRAPNGLQRGLACSMVDAVMENAPECDGIWLERGLEPHSQSVFSALCSAIPAQEGWRSYLILIITERNAEGERRAEVELSLSVTQWLTSASSSMGVFLGRRWCQPENIFMSVVDSMSWKWFGDLYWCKVWDLQWKSTFYYRALFSWSRFFLFHPSLLSLTSYATVRQTLSYNSKAVMPCGIWTEAVSIKLPSKGRYSAWLIALRAIMQSCKSWFTESTFSKVVDNRSARDEEWNMMLNGFFAALKRSFQCSWWIEKFALSIWTKRRLCSS